MTDKSVLAPFWDLASADKDKQLQSAKELIVVLQTSQVIIIALYFNSRAPYIKFNAHAHSSTNTYLG